MEIINPFYLYLILQLDSIKEFLGGAAFGLPLFFGTLGVAVLTCFTPAFVAESRDSNRPAMEERLLKMKRTFLVLMLVGASGFSLNVFLPSSERMAVLVVLPAVANNEAVQAETKEIYDLAKRGLAKLIEEPTEPTATAEESK